MFLYLSHNIYILKIDMRVRINFHEEYFLVFIY